VSRTQQDQDPEILLAKNRLLEVENERLHARLVELTRELASLKGERAPEQLALELRNLEEQLDWHRRKMFGDSSERRPKPPKERSRPAQRGHGPTPQPALPHVETVVELADDDRVCPVCNGTLEAIEGMTEDAEMIDVIERRFLVRTVKRQKYRCRCNGALVVAPPPVKHIARGRYSLDFAGHTLARKYGWHEPLDRQRRAMEAQGLKVTTQTLWDQINALAGRLEPVYDALREHILGADVVGVDETSWRLMNRDLRRKWWVWAIHSGDAVYYRTAPSRSAATAAEVLGDFEGVVVSDGYKPYQTLAKKRDGLRLAMCWAHVRRKFVEAEPNYPVCSEAIDLLGKLFEIDRSTSDPTLLAGDEKEAAAAERLAARVVRAPPILEQLRSWALTQRGLPKSGLRKAIDYMLGHWQQLCVFLDDPYVPLDNNSTERALRGVVVGRKNHYGSRSVRGTEVAAICYSLVESAKLAGLDPQAYIVGAVYGIELGMPPERLLPLRELWAD
jgi:transposase